MIIDMLLEQSIYYEARAARDAASFEREMFAADGRSNWLIIRLEPAADSGSATIPGGYINAETGELIVPEGAGTSIVKSGQWERLAGTAGGPAGDYHWLEPMEEDKRRLDPEDIYSPFVSGGVLLFSPDWDAEGIAQFGAPILLFEDWVAAVPEALESGPHNDTATTDPAELDRLRQSRNPLESAWAWRHSLETGAGDLKAELGAVSGETLALRTRLFLDIGGDSLAHEVGQEVAATTDLSRLEAMAMGAFSAVQLPSPGSGALAREALTAVAVKARQLDPGGDNSPKLQAILTIAGHADR